MPAESWLLVQYQPLIPFGSLQDPLLRRLVILYFFLVLLLGGVMYALSTLNQRKRRADDDKQLAQERYAELVANLKVGICRLDLTAEGRIIEVDRAMLRLVGGQSPADLIGRPMHSLFAEPKQFAALMQLLGSEGHVESNVFHLKTLQDKFFWAAITAFMHNSAGETSAELVLSDITKRMEAENALRHSEERHRKLVEGSIQGIIIHRQFKPLFVNQAFAEIFGFPSPDAVYALDTVQPLLNPEATPETQHIREEALSDGRSEAYAQRLRGLRRDGSRVSVESIAQLVDWDGERAHQITILDVTEKERLEAQLRQSQKMEAVGQLAGGIAHDFNNMLAVMAGYGDLALEQIDPAHPAREDIQIMLEATFRAAALTRQLLAFSRRDVMDLQVVDVNQVVDNVEKMLTRVIGEDVRLRTVQAAGLGSVMADESNIEQIIMNLAVNARDAMPTGGTLTIETAQVTLDEHYSNRHLDTEPGDYVMLAVSDSGTGMDQETQQRIFEPFYTTKELGKGTGLGLSTVYGIVKQMGGSIYVYSEVNRGTTFKIYLPVSKATEQPSSAIADQSYFHGTGTVLLVEDDVHVREATRRILAAADYEVLTAESGPHALALAQAERGRINLMISDVVMPDMSGREVLSQVRLHGIDRVLFMSGYTNDGVMNHGILESDFPFLHKPFSRDALLKKVWDVLQGPALEAPPAEGPATA